MITSITFGIECMRHNRSMSDGRCTEGSRSGEVQHTGAEPSHLQSSAQSILCGDRFVDFPSYRLFAEAELSEQSAALVLVKDPEHVFPDVTGLLAGIELGVDPVLAVVLNYWCGLAVVGC